MHTGSMRMLPPRPGSWLPLILACGITPGFTLGCGGDDDGGGDDGDSGCVSTEVDEFPEGSYGNPESLIPDGTDCEPGSLDIDLNGRWSIVGSSQFDFQMPLIRESCEEGFDIDVQIPGDDPIIHRDDTSIFIRSEFENDNFTITAAARVCAIPGSDELAVAFGTCFQAEGMEEQCGVDQGVMKRFARPEGEGEADGLELVSEWAGGGSPWPQGITTNVKVQDGVAFLSRLGELRIIDVSNPDEPSDLAVIPGEGDPQRDFNDVKLFQANGGTHAVAAGGLCPVVDARDPANPVIVSRLGEYAHSIFVRVDDEGRPLAYLATYGPDVPIYDLSDPANPQLIDRVETPEREKLPGEFVQVHDLYAEQDRLYLNGTDEGFVVMDRDGAGWEVGGKLPTPYSHAAWVGDVGGRKIAIQGDEGVNAYLQVVDVDPESPEFMTAIGTYQTRPEVSIHNMMLFDTRVYLTYYHDGVRILDIADPTNPELLAYYHTWDVETGPSGAFEGAIGLDVDIDAGLIYVADIERGLLILRETP
jgi:hypothetical protein